MKRLSDSDGRHEPAPGQGSLDAARCGPTLRCPIQASMAKVRKSYRAVMGAVSRTAVCAVVFIYNLSGVHANQKLKLTGPVIADIFLGRIKKWNGKSIVDLNAGIQLPDLSVVPCYRADDSGTSYIVSDYLSKVSPRWNREVGTKSLFRLLRGRGGRGSDGLTSLVKNTPGAVGYVELTYALDVGIPFAVLRNADGQWVDADFRTIAAAAAIR
jgi:phosphate transport system substrate-binding protein